jgi:serine/threonine protein kinase
VNHVRQIGPFAIAEVLGEGTGTVLYRAVRVNSSRPPQEVCLRVSRNPTDPTTAAAIAEEYEILRAMDNPRLPKAYGHYTNDCAVGMSYYAGATLSDALQARHDGLVALNVSTAIDIIIEVAHALRHAHSIVGRTGGRIVHGHLGPQRIRLTPKGEIVVVGFGSVPKGRHPAYTAPEIARGAMPTIASDQWAVGAILIELILGERLYAGSPNPEEASKNGDVGSWIQQASTTYPELESVLVQLLAPMSKDRFTHEHNLLKALLAAGRKIGGTVNRRLLVAQVLAHSDKLSKVRPHRAHVVPLFAEDSTMEDRRPPPKVMPVVVEEEPSLPGLDMPIGSEAELDSAPMLMAISIGEDQQDDTDPIVGRHIQPTLSEVSVDTPRTAPVATEREVSLKLDPTAPPAPDPTPSFLPSEIAGMILGGLFLLMGLTYVFWVL